MPCRKGKAAIEAAPWLNNLRYRADSIYPFTPLITILFSVICIYLLCFGKTLVKLSPSGSSGLPCAGGANVRNIIIT